MEKRAIEKKKFSAFFLGNKRSAISGMTNMTAGNFSPDGSDEKALKLAEKVLQITESSHLLDKFILMRAEDHGNTVVSFSDNKSLKAVQIRCDGVIHQGQAAILSFPADCLMVVFHDPVAEMSGMFHASVKTIPQEIDNIFLKRWEEAGGINRNTSIHFLPAICGECLIYDENFFESNIASAIISRIPEKKIDKFIRFDNFDGKNIVKLKLTSIVANLLHDDGYYCINRSVDCTAHSNIYWSHRIHDKDGNKYRNAAFVITC